MAKDEIHREIAEWVELNETGWRADLKVWPLEKTEAIWTPIQESSLILVLEAHRRLVEETKDPRTAAALTLAWATHVTGR